MAIKYRDQDMSREKSSKTVKEKVKKPSGFTAKKAAKKASSVLSNSGHKKSDKKSSASKTLAGSALAQHVSTRRKPDGTSVRVVLKPVSTGAFTSAQVAKAVQSVFARKK